MKYTFALFAAGLALLTALPAAAIDVSLRTEASEEIVQDEVVARLSYTATALTSEEAQDTLNAKMTAAMMLIKANTEIEVTTGGYNTWQHYKKETWEARQSVTLTSSNKQAVTNLVARLQGLGFETQGLSYQLSYEAREAATNALITKALKKAQMRATAIAKELGAKNVKVKAVRHNVAKAPSHPPMMRAEMMTMAADSGMAKRTDPVVEPDEQRIGIGLEVDFFME